MQLIRIVFAAISWLVLAPAFGASIVVTSDGRGQAGFTPLNEFAVSANNSNLSVIVAVYDYATSRYETPVVTAVTGNVQCSVSTGQAQVAAPFGASGTCRFAVRPRAGVARGVYSVNRTLGCGTPIPFGASPACVADTADYRVIGPIISLSPSGQATLTSSVGLPAPTQVVRVTNSGDTGSVLLVGASSSGSPAGVSPSSSGSLDRLEFRDFTLSCSTSIAGSFARTISFAHNATPTVTSPVTFALACQIRTPPTLLYSPATGSKVSIPGTIASAPTESIGIAVSGGQSQGARTLACSVPSGYTVAVETSPFVTGSGKGRIRLGCNSVSDPLNGTLSCTESGSPTRTWDISCDSDPAFTSTPPFSEPIVLNGLVGGPAPTATFTVTNTGTEGTQLQLSAPTGLSGALSISPNTAGNITQGTSGRLYTVTCSTLAAFGATQTLSIVHDAAGSPATRSVTCNILTPPTLEYVPSFGNAVPVSASPGASTFTRSIAVTTTAGDPGGTRSLSCSAPPNYNVEVDGSPIATGAGATIRIGCDSTNTAAGALTCTEQPGGTQRIWNLSCQNVAVYTSSPRPSSAVGVYAPIGATGFVRAEVGVENLGTDNLTIGPCSQSPIFGVNVVPNPIGGASSGIIEVTCDAPPIGSAEFATLSCQTNDPTRQTVIYKLICVAPPSTDPGEGASPEERLTSPAPDSGANLGAATVIATLDNGDEIVVVGAPNGGDDSDGRVYVYVRPAGSDATASAAKRAQRGLGRPVATLRAPANRGKAHAKGIGNKFGDAVAISEDGQFIAVGAPTGGDSNTGQVLVFEMPPGGWGDLDDVTPTAIDPPEDPGVVPTDFGSQVSFTEDGMLVVGAPGAIVSAVDDAGAAFVFDADFAPVGAPITATSPEPGAGFGEAIAVGDGLLAVGAPGENSSTGAAYFFELDAGVVGPANQQSAPGGSFGDKWGSSLAVGGGTVVVGAPNDDTAAGQDSGSATVFVQEGGNAVRPAAQLIPDAGMGTEGAGMALATNGDVVVLGAPLSDVGNQEDRGRALVFDLDAAISGRGAPAGYYENSIGEAGDQFGGAVGISRIYLLLGAPLSDEGPDVDEGRIDPFALDRIFRGGLER